MKSPGKLRRLAEVSFEQGSVFFLPYLVIYFALWWAPLVLPLSLFCVLHVLNLLLLAIFLSARMDRAHLAAWLFWSGLFLLAYLPGAYLEYPSDPWEHFRRLFTFQNSPSIAVNETRAKFAYFWGWTTMFWTGIRNHRPALDVYSAFWQCIVCYQVYLLALKLGFSKGWARLQAAAFLVLFGTNVFGLRYYALSSTPLAYLAYLRLLSIWLDCFDEAFTWRRLMAYPRALEIVALVLLIWANHRQELAFALLSAGVLFAYGTYRARSRETRARLGRYLAAAVAGGFLLGILLFYFKAPLYQRLGLENFSRLGGFKLWSPRSIYLETLGLHGILGLLFAVLFFRKFPKLSLLTLSPVAVLLFPPTALLLALAVPSAYDTYRLMYALPTSLMLVAGLRDLTTWLARPTQSSHFENGRLAVAAILVVALASFPRYPYRGRLYFQLHRPGPERELDATDAMAEWFKNNRKYSPDCLLVSDSATSFAYYTHLGIPDHFDRVRYDRQGRLATTVGWVQRLTEVLNVCGFLVAVNDKIPAAPPSTIARLSGHWPGDRGDLRYLSLPEFELAVRQWAAGSRWKRVTVPPFYELYEP